MAMSKKKGAIKKFAGGKLYLQPCSATGVPTAAVPAPGDWLDLGYVESSELMDETPENPIFDETGAQVETDYDNRSVKYTGNLMQTDKDLVDFLKETVRGKYYNMYHNQGTVDGKVQEIWGGVCTVKPVVQITSGTKRPPFEITILSNDAAVTISGNLPADAEASAVVVPAGEYYLITETTPS